MKELGITFVCFTLLLFFVVAPTQASVSVKSTVADNIYVEYNFMNLDPDVYNEAITNPQFNSSSIPLIITKNLQALGLTHVTTTLQPNAYEEATKKIRVSFYLSGSDIISFTVNRTTMKRTYQLRTDWREFEVNLTSSFSINFAQYFDEPVENWQNPNPTTYRIETHGTGFFDLLSFDISLPSTAMNVRAEGDFIVYETPPYLEDVFFSSPFIILAVFIVAIVIALIYRRVR